MVAMYEPQVQDEADEVVYRGVSRAGLTRTGRSAVPPAPLGRLAEPLRPAYNDGYGRSLARRPVVAEQRRATGPGARLSLGGRLVVGGGLLVVLLLAVMVVGTLVGQGVDFMRSGMEFGFFNSGARVVQLDAFVGHNETTGQPTRFLAANINRQVTVLEFPGGDPAKTRVIIGPYLIGQGEEKTPVRARLQDVNGDGKPDLVVSVKGEDFVYINDKDTFRPITAQEQAALRGTGAAK